MNWTDLFDRAAAFDVTVDDIKTVRSATRGHDGEDA